MKFFSKNYLTRKIMILLVLFFGIISIILLSILFVQFFTRIDFEREWILEGFFSADQTEAQKIEISFRNSQAFQLKSIFTGFITTILVLISLIVIITTIAAVKLFRQTSNVNTETKLSLIILSFLLVIVFVFLSLQPTDVTRTIFSQAFNQTINDVLDRMPYTLAFLAYVLVIISFILNILLRKRFGFLTKDKTLSKDFIDTTKLKNQIEEMLDN